MLKRVDRLQLVVPDRSRAARGWVDVLGAEPESEDAVKCLGAARSTLRVGSGRVELLEPNGAGRVADALAARGAHLFAAGLAASDLDALVSALQGRRIAMAKEAGQAFLDAGDTGGFGMQVVLSQDETLEAVGELDFFYETTLLVDDAPRCVDQCASVFGLDTNVFVPISSQEYGYSGTLTLFRPGHLDRFEIITPTDADKTMGRFFSKVGQCYYMAFAESGRLPEIEQKARAGDLGHTVEWEPSGAPGTVFLHPPVLGGVMLGISRRSRAWQWSGAPDRVVPA